jgi:type IV secretory pathway VirB10-like protein
MPELIEKQKPLPQDEPVSPTPSVEHSTEPEKKVGFFVSKRKPDLGQNNSKAITIGGVVAVLAIAAVFGLSHKGSTTHKPQPPITNPKAPSKPSATQADPAYMPGDHATQDVDGKHDAALSPDDIENTKGHAPDGNDILAPAKPSAGKPYARTNAFQQPTFQQPRTNLGTVPSFQQPVYPYGSAPAAPFVNPEQARAYQDELSKPSFVFSAQTSSTGATSATASEPITNFGLEPGFHVSAHLESSVSTIGGVPAVAIIEYNYMRDGHIIIPAGARVIGKIGGASATGQVQITFSEIFLPNGSRVPINAVALDSSLHLVKGVVTGKNTGKQVLLGALTSAGSLTAGFLNSSSTVTQADLVRNQMAGHIGRSGDEAIQQLQVGQNIVVTVPSGTLVYVTFVAPVRGSLTGAAIPGTAK